MYYTHQPFFITVLAVVFFFALSLGHTTHAGTLSCSVTTAAACTGTVMLRMSGATNAHAELPAQANANYAGNVICCSGVSSLSNACTAPSAVVLRLTGVTNAHVEKNSEANGNYSSNACISVPTGGTVTIGYQATNCTGFDTTLGSLSGTTNSHVGDGTAYTTKICATATGAYASSGYLISTTFDTQQTSGVAYNTLVWRGSTPTNTSVKLQLATSNCSNGATNAPTCNSGAWGATGSNYVGSDCTNTTFYTPATNTMVEVKCFSTHNNKRYFKYKVTLTTTDPAVTPTVDYIVVNYSQ